MQLIVIKKLLEGLFAVLLILIFALSTYIEAGDVPCDILCEAGIQSGPLEFKSNKTLTTSINLKSQVNKLIVSDTKTTQQDLDQLATYITESLSIGLGRLNFDISKSSGDRHSFSINGINIYLSTPSKKYNLVKIKSLSCKDEGVTNSGINDLKPFLDLYNFKIPDAEYLSILGECNFKGIDLNLPTIFALSGIEYEPSSFDMPIYGILEKVSSDIHINSYIKVLENKFKANLTVNLANDLKFSFEESYSVDLRAFHEFLLKARSSILLKTEFTEDDIIENRDEFLAFIQDILINNDYLFDEIINELNYFNSYGNMTFYGISTEIAWSDSFFRLASQLSNGLVDGGLLALKAQTISKLNKDDFFLILDSAGLEDDYGFLALYGDLFYEIYSETFYELKKFSVKPSGLGISLISKSGVDYTTFQGLEENPTLVFTILNNAKFKIYANPKID